MTSKASPNLKEVETQVVQKMTAGATCPVDGQLGAAYVHGLAGELGAMLIQIFSDFADICSRTKPTW